MRFENQGQSGTSEDGRGCGAAHVAMRGTWRSFVRAAFALAIVAAAAATQGLPAIRRDLRGTVDGTSGARVRVTVWHNDMDGHSMEPIAEGFAAADGTFEFRDVAWLQRQQWGSNLVVVVARCERRVGLLEIRGDGVAIDRLRVTLLDTVDLHGMLRNQDGGAPIANAWVRPAFFGQGKNGAAVTITEPLLPWHAVTDADGRFTLKGVPAMPPLRLLAGHDDFGREWIDVPDLAKPIDAGLELGGKVSGVVLLPDGKPAARALVETAGQGMGYGRTTTDDHGRFCLKGLRADVYKVWAEAPDLTVIAVLGLEVKPRSHLEDRTVQLVRGGFIVGRLVDATTGQPFVPGPFTDVAMYGPARGDGGACEATPVLPDGTFRIRAPAGKNRIYLRAAGGWSEPSEVVDVVEGEETKVEWKLRKAGRKK
ncbi:MAG TPA: carboxypeptidase-like regulatory domain-containing protein [Planctomycetota bacterium]|nr:carboxypeptidase-like regulatory domain-containing protein [Planctomycetota bacterium]